VSRLICWSSFRLLRSIELFFALSLLWIFFDIFLFSRFVYFEGSKIDLWFGFFWDILLFYLLLSDWSFQRIHLLFVFLRKSSGKAHCFLCFLYFLLLLLNFLSWLLNHSILFLLKRLVTWFLLFIFIRFLFNNLQLRSLNEMFEPWIFVLLRNVFFELVGFLMERVNTCRKCFWEFRRVQILFGIVTV
jgi:hypothetical protein